MKHLFTLWIALAVFCINSRAQHTGFAMPEFRFTKLDGTTFERAQVPGEKMSFFVFVDTDCDHCQHAVQYISRHYREFNKATIYLVSMNSPARINQFMNEFGKDLIHRRNVVLLQDTRYDFISRFKPRKSPGMFLYSAGKKLLLYGDDEKKIGQFSKRVQAQN